MTTKDDKIVLSCERRCEATRKRGREAQFCAGSVIDAEHLGAEGQYARKLLIYRLTKIADGDFECPEKDCEAVFDRESLESMAGKCALADVCLERAWESGSGTEELGREGSFGFDSSNAGFSCRQPGCDFSAGFSIGGAAGTSGECIKTKT